MKASLVPLISGLALVGAIASGAFLSGAFLSGAFTSRAPTGTEPQYRPIVDRLLWWDDFDTAIPRTPPPDREGRDGRDGRYGRYVTVGAPHLQFADGDGLDGSGALRINWLESSSRPGMRCADDSRLIEAEFPAARELFVQYSVRYSPGFVFDWGRGGRCDGNAKKLFLLWAREGSRFVFISENGWLGVGSDADHPLFRQNRAAALLPTSLADGAWHRITFHVRQSSSPRAADGAVNGWIDGEQRWAYEGVVTHNAGGYHLFKMPATFNQGSPRAQTEWVDELKVWRVR